MTNEETTEQAQAEKKEKHPVDEIIENFIEQHKKTPMRAIFICGLMPDKNTYSQMGGEKATEIEVMGAANLCLIGLQMDLAMKSRMAVVMDAIKKAMEEAEMEGASIQ